MLKNENSADILNTKYLIIGAGPTGLGAAYRLKELGVKDFLVLEQNGYPGGLSASFMDPKGFTWDVGGHVLFSHYEYFDRLVDDLLGDQYLEHQRKAFIRIAEKWVPYPFQNNIRYLPPELQWECIEGLLDRVEKQKPSNFLEWITAMFGEGIARLFLYPYNYKVWAIPPEKMDWRWVGERVNKVDLRRTLKNIFLGMDDISWGPNNKFRFPLHGGTGEIFRRLAKKVEEHIHYEQGVTSVNLNNKSVTTSTDQTYHFDYLFNTSPLSTFVLNVLTDKNDALARPAKQLEHNGVHIMGIGLNGTREDDKCWMYFPENNCPFFRVTNFHNYSMNNAARPGKQRALMSEVSFSHYKQEHISGLFKKSMDGLVNTTLMSNDDHENIISTWEMNVEYGYPLPTLGRDDALKTLHTYLESKGVYSRGRFGGWKYEVGNMDHSVMQGVEWAECLISGKRESTYHSE